MTVLDDEICSVVSQYFKNPFRIQKRADSSGRRKAELLSGEGRQVFVKYATGPEAIAKATSEAFALRHMQREASVRTPEVIGTVGNEESAVLLLSAVAPQTPDAQGWWQAGQTVAQLHRATADQYGLDSDNFIGDFRQSNSSSSDWPDFYVAQRVEPMLRRAVDRAALEQSERRAIEDVLRTLRSHVDKDCAPSLLHGDLWPGNLMFDSDGPLLIDPAISYGNREMDLAFGFIAPHLRFSEKFYEGYNCAWPLPDGADFRRGLWQMWPLLTHVVQDGRRWVPTLMEAIQPYK